MTSSTVLRPFDLTLKTMHITDAGPEEIVSSLYQETTQETWIPVSTKDIDHASRALTPCEQKYSQTTKETCGAWISTATICSASRLTHIQTSATDPHLQRQLEGQCSHRTPPPESTRFPVHHEVHARLIYVTTNPGTHFLSASTQPRRWTTWW